MRTRYKVRVNRAGLVFIGITIFLGIAAVNTANNLLYLVVSYMLSFMLLSGFFSLYNLRGLEVILLPPEEVYAGMEAYTRVIIKNHKRLPSFLIEIRNDKSGCNFPLVKKEAEDTIKTIFEKRGFCKALQVEVASSFPIGLFERFYRLEVPINVIVFPKPLPSEKMPIKTHKEKYENTHLYSRKQGYEELRGIREYTNEPIKLIHWRLSAKTGNLYVKEMSEETAPPITLSLECVDGNLEEKISKLTHLIIELTYQGRFVGLELPNKTIEPNTGTPHKRKLLTELALL
ncbi:MAG: DUF58 domain-containing protein [Aquificaceae bacterium]|nr:DUF58 domain-containing protein [Aquificaceae bacterium]